MVIDISPAPDMGTIFQHPHGKRNLRLLLRRPVQPTGALQSRGEPAEMLVQATFKLSGHAGMTAGALMRLQPLQRRLTPDCKRSTVKGNEN